MNSFFEKLIRLTSIIAIGALLVMPQESSGMAAFKSLFKDMFRDVRLTKALSESIEKSLSADVEKSLGRGLESARAFRPETLNLASKEAVEAATKFKSISEAARKDLLSFKPDAEFTAKLKDEFAFKEVETGEVLDRFNGKIDEIATAKISAAADDLLKTGNKLIEDGEKLAKTRPEEAAKLKADGNALREQANNINEGLISSKKAFTEFKAKAEAQFKALTGTTKAIEATPKSGEALREEAAKQSAAEHPAMAASGEEEFIAKKWFSSKWAMPIWAMNYLLIGLGFSMWNWIQARIERTQAHVAEIATACLPQYFGGFWYRIPDEFINLADPSRSLPIYAPVVRQIQPANFKTEMATSKFADAGFASFFYGASDDETVRTDINNALFGRDHANDVLDMNNLFVTAGANRGNYCGQLGWGAETIFSPYFGRRMLHLPTGLEFYSTGKAIDQKYPLRQIFGDALGISNCDATIETYVGGEFANMVESGSPATVQYDMYNHNGAFYGTGGGAGVDGTKAKAFVDKYILSTGEKTLLDMPSKIDYISDPALPAMYKTDATPRQRLMSASAPLGAFNLQQVQEIDAATWQKLFGVKVKRATGAILPSPLSGYGYCVYQTADTKYIKDVRKALQSKSANAPVDNIVDYVVPVLGTGAEVAPAIIPVIHGKARGDTTPGWIQWEQNPHIKYLYSLVSGHRYNATTGAQESTTIGTTIESSQLVTGALKDTAGQDTLLGLQIKAMKSLLSESFSGKFTWNEFAMERVLSGANTPYVFRVSNTNINGKPTKTTLPIGAKGYLNDFVVPVSLNLEAVDISSADLHYFVSLVTSKIYDAQLAEVSEKIAFAFARTEETSSPSSSLWGSSDKQAPAEVVFWGDQLLDPRTLSGYKVLTQGTTALGTLFTEWNMNPFNQDKLSPGYMYAALRTSLADAYRTASSDPSKGLLGSLKTINNKNIATASINALALRILNAMRSAGLTISSINSVIQKPADAAESIQAVKDFAKTFADTIVSKIIPVLNQLNLDAKNIKDDNARAYLQNVVGQGSPITWATIWQAASTKETTVDINQLILALFESVDDTIWNNALNNLASYASKPNSHWIANPDPKVVGLFNKIGNALTTPDIYDFYTSIADQGLIAFPKMYLYNNQQQLARTASNESPSAALASSIKWPNNTDLVITSYNDYNKYLADSNTGIVALVGPFAFSQQQIPNVLITAIDATHPVYTSSDYPGDYLIVTDNPATIKTAEPFNILKPQAYLVSLFTGNIYKRDDAGTVAPQWEVQDVKQARVPSNTLRTIINSLALPADVLAQLNPTTKQGNWVTYAGRRLYLDPRDEQNGVYLYQDITSVPNITAWETARKTNEFTGVTDFLIGFTKVSQSGDTASVAYGAPLASTPDLISLVTKATYTSTGAAGTLEAQQDPLTAFGASLRSEMKTEIAKLRAKVKEEKTEKAKQTEAVQEKPLGVISQLANAAPQFPNTPFSNLYQFGKFYSVMKIDDTVVGFTDFSFVPAANAKACGVGYYDSTGVFGSALFGEDAQYVRATQGLFGSDCALTVGVPLIIPSITFADMVSVGKDAQLQVGSKSGDKLGFKYDGIYPGTYKFYQFTYPLKASSKGSKDVAIGLGVVAQYTPAGSSTSYFIEMSSGNVFNGKGQNNVYQPEVAHYPVLAATQDGASVVSVSYDASSNPRIFAQGFDDYYYDATYDKDNNDGTSLNTVTPPAGKAVAAYRFYNGAQAFNASVEGNPHYFNAFATTQNPMSLQSFVASDGSSMDGKTTDDLNGDNVSKSTVTTYAYNGTEAMRHYKYLGSTKKVSFGSMPSAFSIEFAKNAHSQLFQFDTGLFVKGKRDQFDNPSMIFVPAVMTDMSATSTANATGFMACKPDNNQVYAPITPANAANDAFKAQFKIYSLQQNNRHYVVVVCQSASKEVEAHYYMPMYEVIDTLTRNAVQDIIGMYAITTASGDNLLVKAIDTTDKQQWRPIQYIFGVPTELENSMKMYVQNQAFFNEHAGSYSYDSKARAIKPSADFLNRYFYRLSADDLSDKKPSYFVGQPVAQFVDLYSGVLFAPRSEQDTMLRPIGNLTRTDLEALLTAKGVRPPDPFEDAGLYRPMSDVVYNPATGKTEERYTESAVGATGRVTVPAKGFAENTPFIYCVPSAATAPNSSGSSSSSSSSSSSDSSFDSSLWEDIKTPATSSTTV